jgi:hypothetical protein
MGRMWSRNHSRIFMVLDVRQITQRMDEQAAYKDTEAAELPDEAASVLGDLIERAVSCHRPQFFNLCVVPSLLFTHRTWSRN